MRKYTILTVLILAITNLFAQTQIRVGQINAGTPNKVLLSNSAGTGSTDALSYDASIGVLSNNVTSIGFNRSIVWIGDSYTAGTGASDTSKAFANMVSHALRVIPVVQGVGGATLFGYVSAPSNLPVKTTANYKLVVAFGTNDIAISGRTVSQFQSDYQTLITNALSKGWTGSDMVFIGIYGTVYNGGGAYTSNIVAANSAIQSLAASNGALYVDTYNPLLTSTYGGVAYLEFADNLHANNFGHEAIKWEILKDMAAAFVVRDQKLMINGNVDLSQLTLKDFSAQTNLYPLGVDSIGKIHPMAALKQNTRTGTGPLIVEGNVIEKNAILPTNYDHTKDWVLTSGAVVYSGIGGSVYSSWEPFNTVAGSTNWRNVFSGGTFNWYTNISTSTAALTITPTGVVNSNYGITFPILTYAFLSANNGRLNIEDNAGNTDYINTYTLGHHKWYISTGTLGTQVQSMDMDANGRLEIQQAGAFASNPNVRVQINSTTEGILIPRLTTAQRNLFGQVLTAVTNGSTGGSGYTSAPTVTFSAPLAGGTTATGTATVSGGQINTITITNPGSGYSTIPTITFTGGGGSGATPAIATSLVDGLIIYNTDYHSLQTYSAGAQTWQQYSTETPLRLTGSGTGSATTISIAHGLVGVTSSSVVTVTANNAASGGISYVTTDATNVNIVYTTAPPSGTSNLSYSVVIKP